MNRVLLGSLCAATLVSLVACGKKDEAPPAPSTTPAPAASAAPAAAVTGPVTIDPAALNAFGVLPAKMESKDNPLTPDKIELGKRLYFDARISANQDVSCNTCHDLTRYGVDALKVSLGHKKQTGTRNSPTVFNAAIQIAQFWDGRAKTIEEQAEKPITNPVEMAMTDDKAVVAVVSSIPEYVAAFKKAFADDKEPVSIKNVGRAIGAFERTLVTPSKWDKFLGGDASALNDAEKAGLKKFMDVGCTACHSGIYLGGQDFKKLGLAKPWPDTKDLGRFAVTKDEVDKQVFKTPILRNVSKTGPYFHDGSVATLEEAVKLMATHQLARDLSDAEVKSIVAFLDTLTGDLPGVNIPKPFPSTAKTPKPNPK